MRKRLMRVGGFVLLLLTLVVIPAQRAGAVDGPACFDPVHETWVEATDWLDEPGTLIGTNKRDVLVGSTGSDVIDGRGGNDLICTGPNFTNNGPDTVEGGAGDDTLSGVGILNGGPGKDYIEAIYFWSYGDGGTGNDTVVAMILAKGDGGSGNDVVVGYGAAELLGGSGNDRVGSMGEEDTAVDCGSGTDYFAQDGTVSTVRRCEKPTDICEFLHFSPFSIDSVAVTDVSAQC